MRILLIANEFPPHIGGVETYAYNLAKALGKRHEVTVLCGTLFAFLKNETELKREAFLKHRRELKAEVLPLLTGIYPPDERAVLEHIAEHPYDAVHINNAAYSPLALKIKEQGIPVFVTCQGKDFLSPWIFGARKSSIIRGLKAANGVIAVSEMTQSLLRTCGIAKNTALVPFGTDSSHFRPKAKSRRLREALGIPASHRVLVTAARIARFKNFECAIKTLPQLPNTTYLILGPTRDRAYYNELNELAAKLRVKERVKFAGPIENKKLPDYYSLSDAFILPSREMKGDVENFGIVVLEAAACGKPVMVSRHAGAAKVVRQHKLGYVFDPKNQKQVLRQAKTLLRDSRLRSTMGRRGRELVVREYDWERCAESITAAYRTLGGVR